MKIKFYGVRGSYPTPNKDMIEYGGNTTCVSIEKEIDNKIHRIIIDSGTGIINLGAEIVGNFFAKKEDLNLNILFTHLHPDHTEGFPFFAPNYFPGANINILGMEALKQHVGKVLERNMLPPNFPIEYADLKSKRKHYKLKDGNIMFIDINGNLSTTNKDAIFKINVMQSYAPSHPQQGAMYYRITDCETEKSIACLWDLESHEGGDKRVIQFAKDCDVMIHDTQYTDKEYKNESMIVQGFGHSTYSMAIVNATQAKVKEKLLCMHYNPKHNDVFLKDLEEKSKVYETPYNILFAKEGMEVEI